MSKVCPPEGASRYLRAKGDTIQSIAEELNKPIMTVHDNVCDITPGQEFTDSVNSKKPRGGGRPQKITDQQAETLVHHHFDLGEPIQVADITAGQEFTALVNS